MTTIILLTLGYGLLEGAGFGLTLRLLLCRRRIWRGLLARAETDEFIAHRLTSGLRRDTKLIFHWLYIRTALAAGGTILSALIICNNLFLHQVGPISFAGIAFLLLFYGAGAAWDYLAIADLRAEP